VRNHGRSLRAAIAVSLEPLRVAEFLVDDGGRAALRAHVLLWMHDYAIRRGVLLDDADILAELEAVIAARRP
jgi:hypothetical protein